LAGFLTSVFTGSAGFYSQNLRCTAPAPGAWFCRCAPLLRALESSVTSEFSSLESKSSVVRWPALMTTWTRTFPPFAARRQCTIQPAALRPREFHRCVKFDFHAFNKLSVSCIDRVRAMWVVKQPTIVESIGGRIDHERARR